MNSNNLKETGNALRKKLVILPGAGCGKEFYTDVVSEFSEYFDTTVVDYNGESFEDFEQDIINKLNEIEEEFIVLAHCFSGLMACNIVANESVPNISGLILCNSVSDFTVLSRDFLSQDNGEHTKDYIDSNINVDKVLRAKTHILPKDVVETHLKIALSTDVTDCLKYINVPTLVLCSEIDGYFEQVHFVNTFMNIENSRFKIVSNARHLGLVTHTDSYLEHIADWVDSDINTENNINQKVI